MYIWPNQSTMTKEEKQKLNEKELYKLFDKGDIDARDNWIYRCRLFNLQIRTLNPRSWIQVRCNLFRIRSVPIHLCMDMGIDFGND